jgi:hypothetical protein
MAGKIFISYRRDDDPGFAQLLHRSLAEEFRASNLFMDVEGHIRPGDNFVQLINDQVVAADVFLVVNGHRRSELLMARADTLPKAIRPTARRRAVGLRPERFKVDCQGLVAAKSNLKTLLALWTLRALRGFRVLRSVRQPAGDDRASLAVRKRHPKRLPVSSSVTLLRSISFVPVHQNKFNFETN